LPQARGGPQLVPLDQLRRRQLEAGLQSERDLRHELGGLRPLRRQPGAGLPDGIFSKPKIPILVISGRSCNGRYWYIYGRLVHFPAIWYILCPFTCYMLWSFGAHFSSFWYVAPRKIWQPWSPEVSLGFPVLGTRIELTTGSSKNISLTWEPFKKVSS
jgi:hypothetical protein